VELVLEQKGKDHEKHDDATQTKRARVSLEGVHINTHVSESSSDSTTLHAHTVHNTEEIDVSEKQSEATAQILPTDKYRQLQQEQSWDDMSLDERLLSHAPFAPWNQHGPSV
jgi:hypothetical protein